MKSQWRVILAIVLVILIAIFAILNVTPVPVSFGFLKVEWPLILVILGALLIGALVIALVSTSSSLRRKSETKEIQKQLDEAASEKAEQLKVKDAEIEDYREQIKAKEKSISELQEKIANGILSRHTDTDETSGIEKGISDENLSE